MTRPLRHGVLCAALLAAACAAPREPPLLALDGRACDSKPVFDGALPVPFDTRSGVAAALGGQSRCLRAPGARAPTTYAAFALPQGVAPSTVTVASLAAGTVVSPRATFYDAAGAASRTLAPEDFRAGVAGLQAGVRLRGTERWLVVEADRAKLGESVTLRLGDAGPGRVRVAASYIYIPYIPPPLPDIARENVAVYALNGTVRVTMAPVPTVP